MTRVWLAIAGLGGGASVIAGALAAHLADDPKSAELLRTGALYGMVHAAALIAVMALAQGASRAAARLPSPAGVSRSASCCSASVCLRWPPVRRAGSAGQPRSAASP